MGDKEAIKVIRDILAPDIADDIEAFIDCKDLAALIDRAKVLCTVFGAKNERVFDELICNAQERLVKSFAKNVALLIQKTWVEESDNATKEHVLQEVEDYCKDYNRIPIKASYIHFLTIIEDAVYLMFGSLTKTKDFSQYAIRVDPDFGVFYGYIEALPRSADWRDEKYRYAVILGMFFLANY